MKILFLHYSFKEDGVTRCTLNNVAGLRTLLQDADFIFAGDSFESSIPSHIEKRYIDWNAQNLISQIQEVSRDADVIVIENPTIGIFPKATLAFREFSEKNQDKKIIYRIHDLIDDRPHLFGEFKKIFNDFDEIYPVSDNVSFLTLTSFDQNRLIWKGLRKVNVLPNSIVVSDLVADTEKTLTLRKMFEAEGIINPDEKILTYPVRVLKRKNIEEAMLLTKILNAEGENYRLLVTIPFDEDYREEIKILAKDYNIKCSIGEVSKYLSFDKDDKFTIADLYSVSDLVISTSMREGFGFAFIEPWLAGTPVIGRRTSIISDFETNGINFNHLYDNSILHNSEIPEERMEKVRQILSNPHELMVLSQNLDLKGRIKIALSVISDNKEAIKKHYNHVNIAGRFLNYIMPEIRQLNF